MERFINAKVLEISRDYWLGDQVALEALVRFSDEELKHQELFRRIEAEIGAGMPGGYRFLPQPDDVASVVLGKSTWAVLALTCHIELFTQTHYVKSIDGDRGLSDLYRDVFKFHWKEEAQHAILDEIEWARETEKLLPAELDAAVDDFIALVGAVDGILQMQAKEDADYFISILDRLPNPGELQQVRDTVLKAYRWQYIVSGVREGRFMEILGGFINADHAERITRALGPILG